MFKNEKMKLIWWYVLVSVIVFIVGAFVNNRILTIIGGIGVAVGFLIQIKEKAK
jgi:hypothetical protein